MKRPGLFLLESALALLLAVAACRPAVTPSPTPIPTVTPAALPSPTPSPSPTAAATPTPSATPTPTPPTPSPTPTPTPPPPFPGVYRNQNYGFALFFPSDWVKQETGQVQPVVEVRAPGNLPAVLVYLTYLPQVVTLEKAGQDLLDYLKQALPKFTVLQSGTSEAGFEAEATWESDGTLIKERARLVLRGTQQFWIRALASTANYDRNQDTLLKITRGFRLEEPAPFGVPLSQTLRLVDTGPLTLDPALSQETRSQLYVNQLFSGLVTFDRELNIVPDIAERWTVEGTTYTFYLRRGVKFTGGREVTAQDFKYSWERAADPALKSLTAATYLGDIVGVQEVLQGKAKEISGLQVVDSYTLRVTIKEPVAYFLAKLTYPVAFVVDRENVEPGGKEWWKKPRGTGPFRLKEWVPDQLIILERNPDYYGTPPRLGYILFRLFAGIPINMYETGEIDLAGVSLSDLERVTDPANPLSRELVVEPQPIISYIGFNATRPPFDDPLVRRAFALALDKDRLIETLLKKSVIRADGFLPPGFPGHNLNLKPLGYDPARARELLAVSKYAPWLKENPITFTTAGEGGGIADYLSAILLQWQENLGVQIAVRQIPPDVFFYQLKEEKDNLFDSGWIADYPDPHNFLDILFYTGSEQNSGKYSHREIDRLLEQARVIADPQQRLAAYQEIEQRLVEDAAAIPLWFGKDYLLVKPYVKGYAQTLGFPRFREMGLER